MGADLYIRSIVDAAKKKYEPEWEAAMRAMDAATTREERERQRERIGEVWDKILSTRGFFRDRYAASGLLQYMGLSWCRDVRKLVTIDLWKRNGSTSA